MSPGIKSLFPLPTDCKQTTPVSNSLGETTAAWTCTQAEIRLLPLAAHLCSQSGRGNASSWRDPREKGGGGREVRAYKHRSNLPSSPPLVPSTGNHTEQAGGANAARFEPVRARKSSNFSHNVGNFDFYCSQFFSSFLTADTIKIYDFPTNNKKKTIYNVLNPFFAFTFCRPDDLQSLEWSDNTCPLWNHCKPTCACGQRNDFQIAIKQAGHTTQGPGYSQRSNI